MIEAVCFTNMCMVEDGAGNVLALDKIEEDYCGTTFPGGHVEEGETFYAAIVREVAEETGLTIEDPVFCGFYHALIEGLHHVILLYRASRFSGTLSSSEEGRVYWIPLEEYRKKELADGMDVVLNIIADGRAQEYFADLTASPGREELH